MFFRLFATIFLLSFFCLQARSIRVFCPYGGMLINRLDMADRGVNLQESAPIYGLFFQTIDPVRFQTNTFLYLCPDINYSMVSGISFSTDRYFRNRPGMGKVVAGVGLEGVRIVLNSTDEIVRAGDIDPLHRFALTNNVIAPFLRAGYRFEHAFGLMRTSFFPWAGVQQELIRGDLYLEPTALWTTAFDPIRESISQDNTYGLVGAGVGINLFHFLDLEAKTHRMVNGNTHYDSYAAMVNLFLSRHWGLSYRYRDVEVSVGNNRFHLFGVAVLF